MQINISRMLKIEMNLLRLCTNNIPARNWTSFNSIENVKTDSIWVKYLEEVRAELF